MYKRLLELLKLIKPHQAHLPQAGVIKSVCYKGGGVHEFAEYCGGIIRCRWCNAMKKVLP